MNTSKHSTDEIRARLSIYIAANTTKDDSCGAQTAERYGFCRQWLASILSGQVKVADARRMLIAETNGKPEAVAAKVEVQS